MNKVAFGGWRISIAVMLIVLGGCAKDKPEPPILSLSSAKECAAKVSTANAMPLAFDAEDAKAIDLIIDENSNCLKGADGSKSLFSVVALPEPGYDYILSVESDPLGKSIFSPRLQFLDSKGEVVREVSREKFIFRGDALTAMLRVHRGERYLAVMTDPLGVGKGESRINGSTQQRTSSGMAGGVFFAVSVNTGSERVQNLTYSYGGKVTVVARSYPKKK